jgi:hypothetical protein
MLKLKLQYRSYYSIQSIDCYRLTTSKCLTNRVPTANTSLYLVKLSGLEPNKMALPTLNPMYWSCVVGFLKPV